MLLCFLSPNSWILPPVSGHPPEMEKCLTGNFNLPNLPARGGDFSHGSHAQPWHLSKSSGTELSTTWLPILSFPVSLSQHLCSQPEPQGALKQTPRRLATHLSGEWVADCQKLIPAHWRIKARVPWVWSSVSPWADDQDSFAKQVPVSCGLQHVVLLLGVESWLDV